MKGYFKTSHKEEQFNSWYAKFKDMFEREVECDNPAIKGKIYEIQKVKFEAPFLFKSKADIVRRGLELKVPYELTWSCYKGLKRPCGKCGTCTERVEAFLENNVIDPLMTKAEWNEAVKFYKSLKNK